MSDNRTTTEELSCVLTAKELADKQDRLLGVLDEIESEDAELDCLRRASKGRVARLESERDRLRRVIKAREEVREVSCYWEFDYPRKRATLIREDTFAVVKDRPLTREELQRDLPLDGSVETVEVHGDGMVAVLESDGPKSIWDQVPDEQPPPDEAAPDGTTCDVCHATLKSTDLGVVCLECKALDECHQYFQQCWESAERFKTKPHELVQAWEEQVKGTCYDGVSVPVVDIAVAATNATRSGKWILIQHKTEVEGGSKKPD